MSEHADVPVWIERMLSWGGGLAGLSTAIGALLLAVWRHGYRSGREAERRRRERDLLERIAHEAE